MNYYYTLDDLLGIGFKLDYIYHKLGKYRIEETHPLHKYYFKLRLYDKEKIDKLLSLSSTTSILKKRKKNVKEIITNEQRRFNLIESLVYEFKPPKLKYSTLINMSRFINYYKMIYDLNEYRTPLPTTGNKTKDIILRYIIYTKTNYMDILDKLYNSNYLLRIYKEMVIERLKNIYPELFNNGNLI